MGRFYLKCIYCIEVKQARVAACADDRNSIARKTQKGEMEDNFVWLNM